jgi:predicted amidohydrolase
MAQLKTLTVAAAQYPIGEPATLAEWEAKIAAWVAEGAATGAQLLVFPEYAAIEQAAAFGPSVSQDLSATLLAVAEQTQARVAVHAALARKHNVHILAGSGPERLANDQYVNAAQLVTPSGNIGTQHKLIMTPFEHDWGVTPGDTVNVFETAIGKIGVAICYDSEFPLLVRAMTEAGAEIILVPSCTERLSGFHRIRAGAAARALESQVAVITSPTVGDALWSPAVDRNTGSAGIFVPPDALLSDTGVIAEGALNAPLWVTGTIDLARLRRLRTSGEMRNHADWDRQPGAASVAGRATHVDLA